jgi:hypothetical protein
MGLGYLPYCGAHELYAANIICNLNLTMGFRVPPLEGRIQGIAYLRTERGLWFPLRGTMQVLLTPCMFKSYSLGITRVSRPMNVSAMAIWPGVCLSALATFTFSVLLKLDHRYRSNCRCHRFFLYPGSSRGRGITVNHTQRDYSTQSHHPTVRL